MRGNFRRELNSGVVKFSTRWGKMQNAAAALICIELSGTMIWVYSSIGLSSTFITCQSVPCWDVARYFARTSLNGQPMLHH